MGKCGQGAVRVVQLVTCSEAGWRAVFELDDGKVEAEAVACWLLVEHGDDRHVHPACAMGGEIGDATQAGNYLGVVAPGVEAKLLAEPVAAFFPEAVA